MIYKCCNGKVRFLLYLVPPLAVIIIFCHLMLAIIKLKQGEPAYAVLMVIIYTLGYFALRPIIRELIKLMRK